VPRADYTLAFLRYYTDQRPTEPDAGIYDKGDLEAAMIRYQVIRAVEAGRRIRALRGWPTQPSSPSASAKRTAA